MGVTPTLGGYPEGSLKVEEKSLFVSLPAGTDPGPRQEVIDFFVALAEKYQQWGVIIKFPGEEAHEYTTQHHELGPHRRVPYVEPHKEEEPEYYTKPAKRKQKDALVFNAKYGEDEPT